MAKKPKISKDITEAKQALKDIMKSGLRTIAYAKVKSLVSAFNNRPPSNMLKAIKDLPTTGVKDYKDSLKTALSVIAKTSLEQARREVPKAKNVKLCEHLDSFKFSEFEQLPGNLQRKIQARLDLLVDTQLSDLDKVLGFQFQNSHDSTDSSNLLENDLDGAADDYIDGQSIEAGAGASAASTVNEARQAFFIDSEVQDQLDAFEFVNGDPVTAVCTELAGTVFSADDPELNRIWPPLHWNCKSTIVPILKGNLGDREITPIQLSKRAAAAIQFSEKCGCGNLSCGKKEKLK